MPDRLEVQFYEAVATEIEEGLHDKGLMAMATAKSLGDKDLARSLYIELRVEQMREEAVVAFKAASEEAKRRKAAERWKSKQERDASIGSFMIALILVILVMALFIGPCMLTPPVQSGRTGGLSWSALDPRFPPVPYYRLLDEFRRLGPGQQSRVTPGPSPKASRGREA
jgi:hypothetical protein